MLYLRCMKKTRVCTSCPERGTCTALCDDMNAILPGMDQGRVDPEDLPRLWRGIMFTRAILDHEDILTGKQQLVVQCYYRERLQQREIAALLKVSQQAVNDLLDRARVLIGRFLKGSRRKTAT